MGVLDLMMVKQKIGVDRQILKVEWTEKIDKVLKKATLKQPEKGHVISGGKEGIHSEHLGHLLSDMQYLQRAYPDAKW